MPPTAAPYTPTLNSHEISEATIMQAAVHKKMNP